MIRVALAGAQDTGKTTIARALAAHYAIQGHITEYVSEYAREHLQRYGSISGSDVLVCFRQGQKEDLLPGEVEIMFTDSPLFLSYIYALIQGNFNTLETLYSFISARPQYDLVLFLRPRHTPRADGVRPPNLVAQNDRIDKLIEAYLKLYELSHIDLGTGNIKLTVNVAVAAVDTLLKR